MPTWYLPVLRGAFKILVLRGLSLTRNQAEVDLKVIEE